MKQLLEKGKITPLTAESGAEGWNGETHLLEYEGEKYVVRKCSNHNI